MAVADRAIVRLDFLLPKTERMPHDNRHSLTGANVARHKARSKFVARFLLAIYAVQTVSLALLVSALTPIDLANRKAASANPCLPVAALAIDDEGQGEDAI